MTRFGKTGGKFAQRWLAEIRAALDESKNAIPVWIMPTARPSAASGRKLTRLSTSSSSSQAALSETH